MAFNLHASGTGGFRYRRSGLDFGDVYEISDWYDRLNSMPESASALAEDAVQGGLALGADEIAGAVTPNSPLQQALDAQGMILGIHLLRESLEIMLAEKHRVFVAIAVRESHMLWPDSGAFFSRWLSAIEEEPARLFLNHVTPTLEAADMNTFGVLAALASVFAEYSMRGAPAWNGEHRMLIQVWH